MLISYCCMLMPMTYFSVSMQFTDFVQFSRNGSLKQFFLCYCHIWLSMHLDDGFMSLIVVFGLIATIIRQGLDDMVLSQLYMSTRGTSQDTLFVDSGKRIISGTANPEHRPYIIYLLVLAAIFERPVRGDSILSDMGA